MLEIRRLGWLTPRYTVHDDRGHGGTWVRRRFKETISGEIDGQPYEVERHGRRHFVLTGADPITIRADAGPRGRWTIAIGDRVYDLRRRSPWRSQMELRLGGATVGSIRTGPRGGVRCDLPVELPPAAQAFLGFLYLTLRARAAASSGAAAASVASG